MLKKTYIRGTYKVGEIEVNFEVTSSSITATWQQNGNGQQVTISNWGKPDANIYTNIRKQTLEDTSDAVISKFVCDNWDALLGELN